jgi:glutamine amidotransferase
LFSHNGLIDGWPDSVVKLAERLPARDLLTLDAPTDSALLWALVRHRLRAGVGPPQALAEVVAEVSRAAPKSRLNLLLAAGRRIAATTDGHSLWWRHAARSVLVSSEPLDDDPMWRQIPDHCLLLATPSTVELLPNPSEVDRP